MGGLIILFVNTHVATNYLTLQVTGFESEIEVAIINDVSTCLLQVFYS